MKVRHVLKNLKLLERNREWLSAPLPITEKIRYYPSVLSSYIVLFSSKNKRVRYLGKSFLFDNPATPLNLQNYPYEVGTKLLGHMRSRPETVLDIGANIGQFSSTLSYLVPDAVIDSFEPNPVIYEILRKNAGPQIRTFNFALGQNKAVAPFYFEPNRSGIGSFFKENAGASNGVEKIEVKVENDVANVTKRNRYDLIKIDVEGFEYEVLHALKGVKTKALYIEVSGNGRSRSYTDAQLYEKIREVLGDYNLIYASGQNAASPTYEMLLTFLSR
jgi:FkbM family methyltransferase